ncbi:dynein axonemal heavy chain 2-like [Aphidius gifuensis]|uniref:dynein axonemal heavy chain 2-like n=1 Tax=Aphidius gifuensis TaxID=684658 RepID=UPI001CDD11C0|nr:dynein axonemal heavy chain 2-like [Aphidius gifuensis]
MTILIDGSFYCAFNLGLSDEEKELFKYLIDDLRRRLKTGRTKLTWNTEFVERYVDQCYEHVTKLDEFFRIYKICCCEIMKICENICDLSFINIKSNYTYKLSEFYDEILIQRDTVFKKIRNKYDEIIRYVLVVIEEYQKILKDNTVEWITYLENLDYLIEDSLRTSLQKSLSALYDVLHGTGKIEPSPFLLIEVTLVDNEITLVPSPNDIAKTISEMLNKSLEKFSSFLKLTSRFELISIGKLNYINSFQDYQTLVKLQKLLDAEMSKCFSLTRANLKIWEPYKDLWKENIDEFMLKYTTLKPTSTSISSDIFRFSAISNNVNLQETVTTVHFVLIDCNHLKTELSDRCSLRLEKLRALSYDTLESHENIHDKIID